MLSGKGYRTTIPDVATDRPVDLVERSFKASAPNRLRPVDLTDVAIWRGAVYVAFVIAFRTMSLDPHLNNASGH